MSPRLRFASPGFDYDAEIVEIGESLLDRTLPKPRWTHAAHFAAAVWILRRRPDLVPERDLPAIIRTYNTATGVENTDTGGYHATITQASLRAARALLAALPPGISLHDACNALLASPLGDKDWPLAYWSRETLFSVRARREWVEPDLAPLRF
jgi:hypothetical protein